VVPLRLLAGEVTTAADADGLEVPAHVRRRAERLSG
jgi:hypothetical protein